MTSPASPALRAAAVRKYVEHRATVTMGEVAGYFGIHRDTLRSWLRAAGVAARCSRVDLGHDRVVRLYRSGLSSREIAVELGSSQTVVARHLKEAGEPPRHDGGWARSTKPRSTSRTALSQANYRARKEARS